MSTHLINLYKIHNFPELSVADSKAAVYDWLTMFCLQISNLVW